MTDVPIALPPTHDPETSRTIRQLTQLFPEQDVKATRIALAIYRQLAWKDRATVKDIAAEADVGNDKVAGQLEAWPAVYRDSDGAVIGFWGLTAQPMTHRVTLAGRDRYTWCAWDALFIPELIGETAKVQSTTPVDNRDVRLRVSPEGATPLDPSVSPIYVSFRVPEADEWEADVIATFCHHVHFLYEEEVKRWQSKNPGNVTLTLDDAFRAGMLKNARQFKR